MKISFADHQRRINIVGDNIDREDVIYILGIVPSQTSFV